MSTSQSATQTICEWVCATRYEDIPKEVRQMACLGIYDQVGCMLAGSLLPPARAIVEFVRTVGGAPHCSVAGFPVRTSVVEAALANGVLGHADELDAIHGASGGGHVLATVVPAALVTGQFLASPGRDVIRAVVLGYELGARMAILLYQGRDAATRRFHDGMAANAVASAVTAGVMLGLTPHQMQVALGLVSHQALGLLTHSGELRHMGQSLQMSGLPTRSGVTAALMARAGYESSPGALEGERTLLDVFLGVPDARVPTEGLGQEYAISDVVFKRYSCVYPGQAPVQGLLEIMSQRGLKSDDIREIHVELNHSGYRVATAGRHPSIHIYSVLGVAAVYGDVTFEYVHDDGYYNSLAVQGMRERIRVTDRTDWRERRYQHQAIVTVATRQQEEIRREVFYRRMSPQELDAKFAHLVTLRAGESTAQELARTLKGLDTAHNVEDVMRKLEMPERGAGGVSVPLGSHLV